MQQTWQEIESHYLNAKTYMPNYVEMHNAMAELCRWIELNGISDSIFGRTSMHTLMLSQTKFSNLTHYSLQYLTINPVFKERHIEFRFLDTYVEDKQWSRIEEPNANALVKRLIGFTKQIGWK